VVSEIKKKPLAPRATTLPDHRP